MYSFIFLVKGKVIFKVLNPRRQSHASNNTSLFLASLSLADLLFLLLYVPLDIWRQLDSSVYQVQVTWHLCWRLIGQIHRYLDSDWLNISRQRLCAKSSATLRCWRPWPASSTCPQSAWRGQSEHWLVEIDHVTSILASYWSDLSF